MKPFNLPGPFSMDGSVFAPFSRGEGYVGPTYLFHNEFSTPRPIGTLDGVDGMDVVDTENCLSIIPNFSTSLGNQLGVTLTDNRCSFADDFAWIDFPTFDAAAHAGLGRIVLMVDANGRYAWGYLGAAGAGETLSANLVAGWDFTSGWVAYNSTVIDSNSVSITSAYGKISLSNLGITAKRLIKGSFVADATAGEPQSVDSYGVDFVLSNNTTNGYHIMAMSVTENPEVGISIRCSAISTLNLTTLELYKVLTPSATGCKVYRDAELTINGWNMPTAFAPNSIAGFNVYRPSSGGKLFFQGGKATPAYGDPGIWETAAVTRDPGLVLCAKITPKDATAILSVGFSNAKTGAIVGNGFRITTDTIIPLDGTTAGPAIAIPVDDTDYYLAVVLRAAGAYFYIKKSTGLWQYLYPFSTNNTATLYPGYADYSMAAFSDFLRVAKRKWLQIPILSDAFTAADSTSNDNRTADGLGHAEGIAGGLGSGGLAVWHSPTGAIQSNRLVITPSLGDNLFLNPTFATDADWTKGTGWTIDGGVAVATTASGFLSQNILTIGKWYKFNCTYTGGGFFLSVPPYSNLAFSFVVFRAASQAIGINGSGNSGTIDNASIVELDLSTCLSVNKFPLSSPDVEIIASLFKTAEYAASHPAVIFGLDDPDDPQNFGLVYLNAYGNLVTEICIAGVYTTIATVAVTFVSGYALRVWPAVNPDTGFREVHVYYNDELVGSFMTLTAPQTTATNGLYAGLFSTALTNSFDSCVIRDIWTGSVLDRIIGS